MSKKLVVLVSCVNVKKLDLKAYGVERQRCVTKVKVGDKEVETQIGIGLDPTWEETFTFDIEDENSTKCFASFSMDGKQIGDTQEYLINLLVKEKPTYKGLIVPGGKVDMMFTAQGFGKEDAPTDNSAFLDMMDDGGMMMSDDEEEEIKK